MPEPGNALFAWLAEFVAHVATKRDLALAAPADSQRPAPADSPRTAPADNPGSTPADSPPSTPADKPAGLRDAGSAVVPDDRSALFERWHAAMRTTAESLLIRARQAQAVRRDLTAADLLTLANALALTSPDPAGLPRLLDLLRKGVETR
jgi:hypothetical protein